MKNETINRTKLLQVRLTPNEYKKINDKFAHTTCRKMSDWVRNILLEKQMTMRVRSQSLDDLMVELTALRKELNAIGNNHNQLVKRLHVLQEFPEIKNWLILNESSKQILLNKVSEIKSKISQINDQWLQS